MRLQDLTPYFELYKTIKNAGKEPFLNAELKSKEKEFIGKEITIRGIIIEVDAKNTQIISKYSRAQEDGKAIFDSNLIGSHFFVFAFFAEISQPVEQMALQVDDVVEFTGAIAGLHRRSVLRMKAQSVILIQRKSSHEDNPKKRCFVATAVYGEFDSEQLPKFYRFRDLVLSKSRFGRILIYVYYKVSPPMAAWIQDKPQVKKIIRRYLLDWLIASYNPESADPELETRDVNTDCTPSSANKSD